MLTISFLGHNSKNYNFLKKYFKEKIISIQLPIFEGIVYKDQRNSTTQKSAQRMC